jgi:hypothetical protein
MVAFKFLSQTITMSLLSALARVFQRPAYTSDISAFVADLKKQDTSLEQRQQDGRAIQWNRKTERHAQADMNAGCVAQRAYPYQTQGR